MNNETITRKKLNELAKEHGIKYYMKYNRFELAEKLGLKLPKPKPTRTRVYARAVQVQDKTFSHDKCSKGFWNIPHASIPYGCKG